MRVREYVEEYWKQKPLIINPSEENLRLQRVLNTKIYKHDLKKNYEFEQCPS